MQCFTPTPPSPPSHTPTHPHPLPSSLPPPSPPPGVSLEGALFFSVVPACATQASDMSVACAGTSAMRRQRRLRAMLRHERQTVAMELAAVPMTNDAVRSPKTVSSRGARRGVLEEPRAAVLTYTAAGEPSAMPLLAAGVDSSSLRFLTAAALAARGKEEAAKSKEVQTEVQQQAAEPLEQARLLLERSKRKRKKRRKRNLFATSWCSCRSCSSSPSSSFHRCSCWLWFYTRPLFCNRCFLRSVPFWSSTGPRCSASWSVWTR